MPSNCLAQHMLGPAAVWPPTGPAPSAPPSSTLFPQVLEFFAARGISADTLARNRVAQEQVAAEGGSTAIAFPYYRCVMG